MCFSFAEHATRRARRGWLAAAILAVLALVPAAAARAQVPVTIEATTPGDDSLVVTITATQVRRLTVDGPEVFIQYARPIDPGAVEAFATQRADWLETAEYGYDSIVLRFLPDFAVTAQDTGGSVRVAVSKPDSSAAAAGGPIAVDPQLVRLEYYRALTLMETGAVNQGRTMLIDLHRVDPGNVEVILLLAQAEERLGHPERALELLDRALQLDPGLEQAVRDSARLHREVADPARLSVRMQSVEKADDQQITVLDGRYGLWPGVKFEYRLENRRIEIAEARRADGRLAAFDGTRQFATFRLAQRPDQGPGIGVSLFAANDALGVGLDSSLDLGPTDWKFDAAFNEPEKDYVEGLIEGAARDHIGVSVQHAEGDAIELRGGISLNSYSIDDRHAGSAVELTGELRRVVYAPWPFMTVGYRLDAEYFDEAETGTAADGTSFDRLPLSSREAHTVDAGVEGYLTDYVRARATGGYTVDRLNGHGPSAEMELVYEPLPDLEVTAGMGTSLAVTRGSQSQLLFGGLSVRTRF